MRLPNKLFEYKKTVISKSLIVMSILENEEYGMTILELFKESSVKIGGAQVLLETLDLLYALGKVKYDSELRRLFSVK